MKKSNIFLLVLICLLSLCLVTGLMVYAFQVQLQKDSAEQQGAKVSEQATQSPASGEEEKDTVSSSDSDKETSADTDKETSLNRDNASGEEAEASDPSDSPSDTGNASASLPEQEGDEDTAISSDEPIVLTFAGDINLDENSKPVAKYDAERKGILGGIAKELVDEMRGADLMMLNNEFPYSLRGVKTPDKSYTFRADPKRVQILEEMGVDIVSLANNHALDYGPDALEDTFTTLEEAGIEYVGAGRNMDRAKAPIYFTVKGKKIAFIAASRVIFAMDWYATDTRLGMVGTYDPAIILESVKEAKENSDYVIIYVHWGVERQDTPEKYQRTLAKQYIDAGADAVIGCHPHVMQGFEFYKGKPIAYSLGNYWFNNTTREAGLLKLYLEPNDTVRVQFLPTMGSKAYTYPITEASDRKKYFEYLEKISFQVDIDEEGFLTEKTAPKS